jgi:hypothetical protein
MPGIKTHLVLFQKRTSVFSDPAANGVEQTAERAAETLEDIDQDKAQNAGNDAIFEGRHAPPLAHHQK